ncbi:hypothetical protein D3C87_2011370 [compost metagenome]
MADLAQLLAQLAFQLGGKRPGAHAGGVGLGDADDAIDRRRAHARADAGPARDRVRRGDEGVGALIEA